MFSRLLTGQRQIKSANKTRTVFLAFFVALIFGLFATAVSAQSGTDLQSFAQNSGLPTVNLATFIGRILQVFMGLLGVIALALLMYGGFIWMTASGDPNKVEKAKQIIKNAVIGLVIIFSAFAITSFLMGIFGGGGAGGGGGQNNMPGGNGDWSRSAIGGGPIQSVYPYPNQTNVPINTMVTVTFKQAIKADSICDTASGKCDGQIMKNVEICEISATSSNCLVGSADIYASSTVTQTEDGRTFVFSPKKYLGEKDDVIRTFKVTLKEGIKVSSTNETVFKNSYKKYYLWSFKTNGKLDLDPPEVSKFEIYPNPDVMDANAGADEYTVDANAQSGNVTITFGNRNNGSACVPSVDMFAQIVIGGVFGWAQAGSSFTLDNPAAAPSGLIVRMLSPNGFTASASGTVSFTISDDGTYATFVNGNYLDINFTTTGVCSGKSNCLPINNNRVIDSGKGFTIEAIENDFPHSLTWSFEVVAGGRDGRTIHFMDGNSIVKSFIFVPWNDPRPTDQPIVRTLIPAGENTPVTFNYYPIKTYWANVTTTAKSLAETLNAQIGNYITATNSANSSTTIITVKNPGLNNFKFSTEQGIICYQMSEEKPDGKGRVEASLAGLAKVTGWATKPSGSNLKDPYNNSLFRITFNEPINPVGLENFIKVKAKIGAAYETVSSTISFANQYRTVELKGSHFCGFNACGRPVSCWIDPNPTSAFSVPFNVEIAAASLKTCEAATDSWCIDDFKGSCSTGTRCQRPSPSSLYYSQASDTIDGVIDMSKNSFNGNFNTSTDASGRVVGNAEGQTGTVTGTGKSGYALAYDLNAIMDANYKPTYLPSDTTGDNFTWSFFVSNQIDDKSPLVKEVAPVGNQIFGWNFGESFSQAIEITFDRLMSATSLKPGYGYSEVRNDESWFRRFLLLKTLVATANPVGYWITFMDDDIDNDSIGDVSKVFINHNPFDQSVSYGPLAGSGLESITQNCFLPGAGPQNAGDPGVARVPPGAPDKCQYATSSKDTTGCVSDPALTSINQGINSANPTSYGYMNCLDIEGAVKCDVSKECKTHYSTTSTGSWIITKDFTNVTDGATPGIPAGRTGCCFGKCQ